MARGGGRNDRGALSRPPGALAPVVPLRLAPPAGRLGPAWTVVEGLRAPEAPSGSIVAFGAQGALVVCGLADHAPVRVVEGKPYCGKAPLEPTLLALAQAATRVQEVLRDVVPTEPVAHAVLVAPGATTELVHLNVLVVSSRSLEPELKAYPSAHGPHTVERALAFLEDLVGMVWPPFMPSAAPGSQANVAHLSSLAFEGQELDAGEEGEGGMPTAGIEAQTGRWRRPRRRRRRGRRKGKLVPLPGWARPGRDLGGHRMAHRTSGRLVGAVVALAVMAAAAYLYVGRGGGHGSAAPAAVVPPPVSAPTDVSVTVTTVPGANVALPSGGPVVMDGDGTLAVNGFTVQVSQLRVVGVALGPRVMCVRVGLANGTTSPATFKAAEWSVRQPDGKVVAADPLGTSADFSSGQLVPGATTAGDICFDDPGQRGTYTVRFRPPNGSSGKGAKAISGSKAQAEADWRLFLP